MQIALDGLRAFSATVYGGVGRRPSPPYRQVTTEPRFALRHQANTS